MLDRVFELAHVAGPGVLEQTAHGFSAEVARLLALGLGEPAQKNAGQERDVVGARAQRRHLNRDYVQAIVEVLSEITFAHFVQQVPVGGGDDPDVDGDGPLAPQPFELLGLQDAQEPDLRRGRDFADFVQEHGAAVGLLEPARLLTDGPGEGAFLVAEELAFEKCGREGRAVDDDERFFPALAEAMNGLGRQLLARAAFALDQHGGVRGRRVFDQLENRTHLGGFADDPVELLRMFDALLQAAEPLFLKRRAAQGSRNLPEYELDHIQALAVAGTVSVAGDYQSPEQGLLVPNRDDDQPLRKAEGAGQDRRGKDVALEEGGRLNPADEAAGRFVGIGCEELRATLGDGEQALPIFEEDQHGHPAAGDDSLEPADQVAAGVAQRQLGTDLLDDGKRIARLLVGAFDLQRLALELPGAVLEPCDHGVEGGRKAADLVVADGGDLNVEAAAADLFGSLGQG